MKRIKQILAILLALCVMVGIPMSVSAVGESTPADFRLLYAMEMPDVMAKNDADKGRTILLYFNSTPKDPGSLYFELLGYDGTTLGISLAMSVNQAYGKWGQSNPIAITMDVDIDGNYSEEKTLAERFSKVADRTWYIAMSQPDKVTGAVANNSQIDGWKNTSGQTMATGGDRRNAYIKGNNGAADYNAGTGDALLVPVTRLAQNLTVKKAGWVDDTHIRLEMSEPVFVDTARVRSSLRIVNAQGQTMYYHADGSYSTSATNGQALEKAFALQSTYKAVVYAYLSDSNLTVGPSDLYAHLDTLREQNGNAGYKLCFTIGEAAVKPERGEYVNNGLVDTVWSATSASAHTYKPLFGASYDGSRDRVYLDVTPATNEELTRDYVVLEKARTLKIDGEEHLILTFSEPIRFTTDAAGYLRLYHKSGVVSCYRAQNGQLSTTKTDQNVYLQWRLMDMSYYGPTKQCVSVKLYNTPNLGGNTYAAISDFVNGLNADTITEYRLAVSLHNNANGYNQTVESITSVDGTKSLYANSFYGSEDRAVVYAVTDNGDQALKITDVDIYNERNVILTFNQSVTVSNNVYAAIRLVDDTNTVIHHNGEYMQWWISKAAVTGGSASVLSYYGRTENQLIGHLSDIDYSAILAKQQELSSQGVNSELRLCFEDLGRGDSPYLGNDMVVDAFWAKQSSEDVTGRNYLLANKLTTSLSGYDGLYLDPENPDPVRLVSAQVTAADTLTVTFSQPVLDNVYSETKRPTAQLHLTDGQMQTVSIGGYTYYWNGTMTPVTASGRADTGYTTWTLTDIHRMSDGRKQAVNLYDLLAATAADSGTPLAGYGLSFGLEQVTDRGDAIGWIDNITDPTGKHMLKATLGKTSARVEVAGEPLDGGISIEAVSVESLSVLNEKQIKVVFSQPVRKVSDNLSTIIRVTDADGYMAAMDPATKAIKNYTGTDAIWIQWGGTLEPSGAENYSKEWVWTMTSQVDRNGDGVIDTLSAIYDMWEANWKTSGLKLNFAIESYTVARDGMINEWEAQTGRKVADNRELPAKTGYNAWSDALHVDMTQDPFFTAGPLTYTSVVQTSTNQLVVTFSQSVVLKDVTVAKPFIGLRLVQNSDDQLIYASGKTVSTGASGKPQQWSATGYQFLDEAQTQLLVTFADNVDIYALVHKTGFAEPLAGLDARVVFAIEEKIATDCGANADDGLVWSIQTPQGRQLQGGKSKGQADGWDGAYHEIEVIDPQVPVSIREVTITGENTLTITFSEAIVYDAKTVWLRYVNPDTDLLYYDEDLGYAQWKGRVEYADASQTKLNWTLYSVNNSKTNANSIYDIVNFNGAIAAFKDLPGTFMICMEETENPVPGFIDTFHTLSGKGIMAAPYIPGSWDGLYYPIDLTEVVKGGLAMESVEVVSDIEVIGTFSAPVAFAESNPYVGLRLLNAEGYLMYLTEEGEYTTKASENGVSHTPVQWAFRWEYENDEHTKVRYTLKGGSKNLPVYGVTDVLSYDWDALVEGAKIWFVIEEANADMIIQNGHMDNIRLESDPSIALDADHFASVRDAVKLPIALGASYKPLTAKAEIINDVQIRVSFSSAVTFTGKPYLALRYVDANDTLLWNGEENVSTPIQFSGTWEWDDESHTSLTWTINGNGVYGANTVQDVVNRIGYLGQLYPQAQIKFCIEEASLKDVISTGGFNGVIDNITADGGKRYLKANTPMAADRLFLPLDTQAFVGMNDLTLESVRAIDDQTLEVHFSGPISWAQGEAMPSMAIRYLSQSGDSEVLTDGKTAVFKGAWEYADEKKDTLIWKLDSKHVKTLTEIFNFEGNLVWNQGAKIAFVIMDAGDFAAPVSGSKLYGVTSLDGLQHLSATYVGKDYLAVQQEIEIAYNIPTSVDEVVETVYVTNYLWYTVAAAAILLGCGIVAAGMVKKSRREER